MDSTALDRLFDFLRRHPDGVDAVTLVTEVLRIPAPDPAAADKLVAGMMAGVDDIVRNEAGRWQLAADSEDAVPLADAPVLLLSIRPGERGSPHPFSVSLRGVAVQDGNRPEGTWLLRSANHPSMAREIGSILAAAELAVHDGGWRLLVDFLQTHSITTAIPDLDIRPLAREVLHLQKALDLAGLANHLDVPFLSGDDPECHLANLETAWSALQEHLPDEAGNSVDALLKLAATETDPVEFDGYNFSRLDIWALPAAPGVYVLRDREYSALYVGKSRNLRSRVRTYFRQTRSRTEKEQAIIDEVHDIEIHPTGSDLEALLLEQQLINELGPRLNRQRSVHKRRESAWDRRNLVLLLPAADENEALLILLAPNRDVSIETQPRFGTHLSSLGKRLHEHFYTTPDPVPEPTDAERQRREIVRTWLRKHADGVALIDVDDAGSVADLERILADHLADLETDWFWPSRRV